MVLVTGGTGFIGSYIIKELVQKGYQVKAIRRPTAKLPFYIPSAIFEQVNWFEGDILDPVSIEAAMEGVSSVIHSAAIVSFDKKLRKQMMQVNVEGTANMVNIALEKNISRFVHLSSVAAVGRSKLPTVINEEQKWEVGKMTTHYAISKQKSELQVWRAVAEGLNAVIINPSTVLGFGDWDTSSCRIFKSVYEEFPWYTTGMNGFVDIEDVSKAAVMLMESGIVAERFIVNGDNRSFQDLFNTIADAFGKKHPTRKATPFLTSIALVMGKVKSLFTGKQPLLTKETAMVARNKSLFDNSKILSALPGFSFTPLEETIKKACKNYMETIKRVQP